MTNRISYEWRPGFPVEQIYARDIMDTYGLCGAILRRKYRLVELRCGPDDYPISLGDVLESENNRDMHRRMTGVDRYKIEDDTWTALLDKLRPPI
ncbi:MAG TPA: hypothetical protein VM689_11655 [Aliidongia sp.]|nr:hypothetical protein [Aliidongia sp.]